MSMVTPVMLRGNYSALFGTTALPALESIFRTSLRMIPMQRNKLFSVTSTDRDIVQATEMGDLPGMIQIPEGTDYTFVAPRPGWNKTYIPQKFGLGFSISREMVDDAKWGVIGQMVGDLARSAAYSQEQAAMDIFNNGFTTVNTGGAGLSLFSSAQTLPSGLTFRNRPTVDVDLSQSSLDAALTDFSTQQVTDSGKILATRARILIVHPSQERYARELVGSTLKPDTNDNNLNAFLDDNLTVVTSALLTDPDAWFLSAAPGETGLQIIRRQGIRTESDESFVNDALLYKVSYREAIGFAHGYGVYGSPGA